MILGHVKERQNACKERHNLNWPVIIDKVTCYVKWMIATCSPVMANSLIPLSSAGIEW